MRHLLIIILMVFTSQIHSQYKFKIDSTFGENGFLSFIDLSSARKIFLYPDEGHIYADLRKESGDSRKVYRFDLNGQPDYSYFNSGYFDLSFVKDSFDGGSLLIDRDKAIYISRGFGPNESRTIEIIKISPEGNIDTSFGEEGYARKSVGAFGPSRFVYGSIQHIDRFNKLLLTGTFELASAPFLMRINPDGTTDTSLSTSRVGHIAMNFTYSTIVYSMRISPFGGYYFMGTTQATIQQGAPRFDVLWKINYYNQGQSSIDIKKYLFIPYVLGTSLGSFRAIQIAKDQGYYFLNKWPDFYRIHKFNSNMKIDSTFATNGYFNIPQYHLFNDKYSFNGMHLTSLFNGENYIFGTSSSIGDSTKLYPSMVCFTDEGEINSEFGNLGLQYFPIDNEYRFEFQEIMHSSPEGELYIQGRQYLKPDDQFGKPFIIKLIKTDNLINSNTDNASDCEASAVPNPVNNKLSIHISDLDAGSAKIEIFQINGYTIYRSDNIPLNNGTINLDSVVLDLSPGVYFLIYQTENCKGEIKIIKR